MEFWGQISFLKGGINFSDRHHDGEPDLREGNSNQGIRRRVRRHSCRALGRSPRDAQWHRHRPLGSARAIRFSRSRTTRRSLEKKDAAKRALIDLLGPGTSSRSPSAPACRHCVAAGRSKGLRSHRGACERACRRSGSFAVLGTGDPRYENDVARSGRSLSRSLRCEDRVRRVARPPDRRRRRHVSDAVAFRAVRAEPDVQHALRHRAARPGHGRAGRYRYRLQWRRPETAPASSSRTTRRPRCWGRMERARAVFANPNIWKKLQVAGMRQDFSWDRSAREYVKLYEAP